MSNEQQNKPVTVTYPDGQTASRVVDLLVRKKPIGWGRRSYSSYYKEEYAIWIKKELDALMNDKRPRLIPLRLWPNTTLNTLYLRVQQAWQFLRDYLDPDDVYEKLWIATDRHRVRGNGVTIAYSEISSELPCGEVFVPRTDTIKWKMELDKWLDNDEEIKPFHKDKLMLTPEDVAKLKAELEDVVNIQFIVKANEVKVIKVS